MSEFEHKATSHIPPEILNSISREVNDGIEGSTPLEAIMKMRQKTVETKQATPEVPQKKQTKIIVIDNRAIEVPLEPFEAMVTLFAYYMATIGWKDKKVKKILDAFNFSFVDVNKEPIYPVETKKK